MAQVVLRTAKDVASKTDPEKLPFRRFLGFGISEGHFRKQSELRYSLPFRRFHVYWLVYPKKKTELKKNNSIFQ